jgi:flagellar secretion chaperone FliS
MYATANDAYLENRVLSADPMELVRMLYQAAIAAVRTARRHLETGDIAARSHSINKACAIVAELQTSLDHERGGDLSARLDALYDYLLRKLLDANFKQSDACLAEVLGLLSTLSEGWDGAASSLKPAAAAESIRQQPIPPAADLAYAPRAWSL